MPISSPLMTVQSDEAARQFGANKDDANAALELNRRLADEAAALEARRIADLLAANNKTADDIARQTNDANATTKRLSDEAAAKQLADSINFASFQQQSQARTLKFLQEQQLQAQQYRFSEQSAAAAQAAARAAEARKFNEGRQQRIASAKGQIDDAFAGFDDSFYQDFKTKFLDYYAPRIDKSFSDAGKDLTLKFADTGNLNSSAAARSFGELTQARADAEAGVATQADDGARSLKNDVLKQRNEAISAVFSSANTAQQLPDGLDAESGLRNLDTQLGEVSKGITDRVAGFRAPTANALPDALSGFRDALSNVRRPSTTFARSGAYTPSSSNSAYTVG